MTLFDIGAGLVLLVSAVFGLIRGATREITTVVAFVAAAVVAVFALRFTGPLARQAIHTDWIANTVAVLVMFILVYILFRVMGGAVTRRVQETATLSSLDRILGAAIGLVRGAVILGAFALLLSAATPPGRMPAWISQAKLYPMARMAGNSLRAFAPEGLRMAHTVAPVVEHAVREGQTPTDEHKRGYTDEQRRSLDDLVEKSR